MRRRLRLVAWAVGALVVLALLAGVAVVVVGNTDKGRRFVEDVTYRLSGGYVKLTGLNGDFPTHLTADRLELIDHDGVWLFAEHIALTWSPLGLFEKRIQVDTLHVERLRMERLPVSDGKGGKASVPDIEVGQCDAIRVELGAALAGAETALSLKGDMRMRSLDDVKIDADVHRLDSAGDYTLHVRFDPKRMDAQLAIQEPAHGPLQNLIGLPELGAIAASANLSGPRSAEIIDVTLAAGALQGHVKGSVDLIHESADLEYELQSGVMAPRGDVAWHSIALDGTWHGALPTPAAAGHLRAEQLRLPGGLQLAKVTADLATSAGTLSVRSVVAGLQIPGPQPQLFSAAPLLLDGSWQLNAAARPVEFSVAHPLLTLRGYAETLNDATGKRKATAQLKTQDMAPFAAFADQEVHGAASVDLQWIHDARRDGLTVGATLGLTGGTAAWIDVLGPQVKLQLAGSISPQDIKIDDLRVASRASVLAASGSADRAASFATGPAATGLAALVKDLQVRWQLNTTDLATLSSDVSGDLKASGRLGGRPGALQVDADLTSNLSVRGSAPGTVSASLRAVGIAAAPSATLKAHGMLDQAPLTLDAKLEHSGRDALHIVVNEATWKSAHIDGDLDTDTALTRSQGSLRLHVAQLSDFDRLIGTHVTGRLEGALGVVPIAGHAEARLQLDAGDVSVAQFTGNMHLQGQGGLNSFAMLMTADVPNLNGAPAHVASTADLNIEARQLQLQSLGAGYRGQTLTLSKPAILSFAQAIVIDDLRLGLRDAVLDVQGQLSPTLDVTAALQHVTPELINAFSPSPLASGDLDVHAHLEGSPASPSGEVRLDATNVRSADDAATGLPAFDAHATALLNGDSATIDAKLSAGSGSQLTASGTGPLNVDGAWNMKIGGKLDVAVANPFLEARGMHATGQLTADASVTGSTSEPQVAGGLTLASGSLRDYGRGVNLTNITAELVGNEGTLEIRSFNATAASGTMAMTGTLGVLQPHMPLELKIVAKNAQPVASSVVTANFDADVHVSGTLRERVDVAGKIHINRATIGIPNSLPPDVAVLDVRRRGQTPVALDRQLVIGVDVTVDAPQQLLVQGRGLDAEMGGSIHLTGTTDELLVSGFFEKQRGTFTLAGNRLTITDGRVSFDGAGLQKKIDPTLDFTAQTTLSDASTASLHITGVADAPRFEFTSTTGLPQDEVIALLLFGKPAAQLSGLEVAQAGAALATLTGIGGGGLNPLVKLQKSLGLDRLSVGANTTNTVTGPENSGAAIQAGRYISRRVYVEGRQSTTGTSQVQVDVDLTKHLKLQTRLGNGTATTQGTTPEDDPGSSIGLSYQFEY